jgi:hypothetical protein
VRRRYILMMDITCHKKYVDREELSAGKVSIVAKGPSIERKAFGAGVLSFGLRTKYNITPRAIMPKMTK